MRCWLSSAQLLEVVLGNQVKLVAAKLAGDVLIDLDKQPLPALLLDALLPGLFLSRGFLLRGEAN